MKAFRPAIAPMAARACGWRATHAASAGARWPALRLQWRRGARPQGAQAPAADRAATTPSWQTSIHLHFSSLHQTTKMFSTRVQALPVAVQGMLLKEAWAADGATRHAPVATAMSPARPARAASAASASTLMWRTRDLAARPAAVASGPRPVPAPAAVVARAAASTAIRLATIHRSTTSHLAWRTRPVVAARQPLHTSSGAAPQVMPPGQAAPWQTNAPALVWRKPGTVRAAQDEQSPAPSAARMVFASPIETAIAPPPAAKVLAPVRQQLQAAALDPGLADRLADEVIRRVERSMRIERERRGH